MEPWMQEWIDRLTSEYGTVPPMWVLYNEHPYSICWRMGSGESFKELWWEWWQHQNLTEDQKIEYFRKWLPPHCWLEFLIDAIWDTGFAETEDSEELLPYFIRTSELGFGDLQDYKRDLEDPKWLDT